MRPKQRGLFAGLLSGFVVPFLVLFWTDPHLGLRLPAHPRPKGLYVPTPQLTKTLNELQSLHRKNRPKLSSYFALFLGMCFSTFHWLCRDKPAVFAVPSFQLHLSALFPHRLWPWLCMWRFASTVYLPGRNGIHGDGQLLGRLWQRRRGPSTAASTGLMIQIDWICISKGEILCSPPKDGVTGSAWCCFLSLRQRTNWSLD